MKNNNTCAAARKVEKAGIRFTVSAARLGHSRLGIVERRFVRLVPICGLLQLLVDEQTYDRGLGVSLGVFYTIWNLSSRIERRNLLRLFIRAHHETTLLFAACPISGQLLLNSFLIYLQMRKQLFMI